MTEFAKDTNVPVKIDYISRKWLLAEYDRRHKGPPGGARQLIEEPPAADVRPVIRGRWIFDRGDLATCSNCGSEILKRDVRNHKLCHYCGADMRKEDGHDRDL